MRLLLVTGRRAEDAVRKAAARLEELTGWDVDVYVAPIDVAALLPKEALKRIVERVGRGYDAVIVSGMIGYDVTDIASETGVKIVKGPEDPYELVIAAEAGLEAFKKSIESGRFDVRVAVEQWLRLVREVHSSSEAVEVCGVRVPLRPPPIVVAAEVYVRGDVNQLAEKARSLLNRGADILVVGLGFEHDYEASKKAVSRVWDAVGPVAVDSPNPKILSRLAAEGYGCLLFSATADNKLVESVPKGVGVVVTPVNESGAPRDAGERVELLKRLVEKARSRGLVAIADPVLEPPLQGLASSITAYYMASKVLKDTPLLAGVANVYELLDVDSHGVVGVLVPLLAEAGVSIVLASEESRKTAMSVTETAVAATMTSIAMLRSTTPKNLGIDLLSIKEKRPVETSTASQPALRVDADSLDWHPLRLEDKQHIIYVDKNVIRDIVLGNRVVEVYGSRARAVYRAIAYLGLARKPDHLAYLGYELCKAELAATLGKSYIQDHELITPPWRNRVIYSSRLMNAVRV